MSEVVVAEREIAPGIKINSGMTGAQILNAHLQAAGEKPLATPHVTFSGPVGHPHTVVPDAEAGTIGNKAPPPSPKQVEAANKPKVATFDAEMRAAGKQLPLDRPTLTPGQVDQEGIEALSEHYRALVAPLYGKTDAASVATAERFKRAYENDVRRVLDGQPLTAQQVAKLKTSLGKVDTFVSKTKETAPAPTAAPGWQSHIVDREWVPLDKLTLEDTHGFTVPRYVANQRLHVSTFDLLKKAKAAGISQAQANAVFQQEAVNMGWVKA
jgi:hypothetical protein